MCLHLNMYRYHHKTFSVHIKVDGKNYRYTLELDVGCIVNCTLKKRSVWKKNRTIPLWLVVDFLPYERFVLFSFSLWVMRQKPQSSNGHVYYFSPNTESCLCFPQLKCSGLAGVKFGARGDKHTFR